MDIHKLVSCAQSTEHQITIEATVVTGFEDVVLEECTEKFGKDILICKSIGRVFFNVEVKDVNRVKELRGVDNILVIIANFENFGFSNKGIESDSKQNQADKTQKSEDKATDIATIQESALKINWKKYMEIWRQVTDYKGILYPSSEQFSKYNNLLRHKKNVRHEMNVANKETAIDGVEDKTVPVENNDLSKEELLNQYHVNTNEDDINIKNPANRVSSDVSNPEEQLLKFRVTCNRVGKHTVSSMEIERAFGGKLNDTFLWLVDLDDYDIDISLQVRDNEVYVGLPVTRKSLHRRNIVEFNLTTLKATIGYNMVRLASPMPGDIFLDPMCGGGTIPLECALSFPATHFLCGDINEKLVLKTQANAEHNSRKAGRHLAVSPLVLNGRHLCLKPACVDGIVSDLPFGKRVGSKSNNFLLYRLLLIEIGKVSRPRAGRAILLTSDRKHLIQALHVSSALWKCKRTIKINMSGIRSFVFVLSRTAELFDYAVHGLKDKYRGKPFPPRQKDED